MKAKKPSPAKQTTKQNREVPICHFFVQGRCRHGDSCRFRHEEAGSVAKSTQPKKKRTFCPYIASAIQKAKDAQDREERPYAGLPKTAAFFSMDVECVATGTGHSQRTPARVALVDGNENTLLDEIVRIPKGTVASYLTQLTGLTAQDCEDPNRKTLDEIVALVKKLLPKDAILIGQSIQHDIDWLGLKQGHDYADCIDIGTIFRQRIPHHNQQAATILKQSKSAGGDLPFPTRYRLFSLRHCCIHLLGVDIQEGVHDPVSDAKFSMRLFQKYRDAPVGQLRACRDTLHRAPPTPSFSVSCPVLDGVCLSKASYTWKHAARFIWKWWLAHRHNKSK